MRPYSEVAASETIPLLPSEPRNSSSSGGNSRKKLVTDRTLSVFADGNWGTFRLSPVFNARKTSALVPYVL
jgi:hypothetical protein